MVLSADSTVFTSIPILYNVHEANTISEYNLNPANVRLTPDNSDICPEIKLDVVYDDVHSIDNSIFTFNQETNVFSIDTKNTDYTGAYSWKLVASFADTYS